MSPIPKDTKTTVHVIRNIDALPPWLTLDELADFFHESLKPYEDTREDIRNALQYAFEASDGPNGFAALAIKEDRLAGSALVHFTPWSGYVPSHLLLFIAVHPSHRRCGIGQSLLETVIASCNGDIKLHVEHDNPAKRLYERAGFRSEYAEMRLAQ